jgi:hypothetical protein
MIIREDGYSYSPTSGLIPVILIILALFFCSCATTYWVDRAMDLTDIIDIKYGFCGGAGAKIEATDYLAAGLGLGVFGGTEFYGRRSIDFSGYFFHFLLFGSDIPEGTFYAADNHNILFYHVNYYHVSGDRVPIFSRGRFGGEILLPVVTGGLYFNLGELIDFFAGFGGVDLAEDDGLFKGASLGYYLENGYDKINKREGQIKEAIKDLEYGDVYTREKAVETLGKWKAVEAVDELIFMLQNEQKQSLKRRIVYALKNTTDQDFGFDADKWYEWWKKQEAISNDD